MKKLINIHLNVRRDFSKEPCTNDPNTTMHVQLHGCNDLIMLLYLISPVEYRLNQRTLESKDWVKKLKSEKLMIKRRLGNKKLKSEKLRSWEIQYIWLFLVFLAVFNFSILNLTFLTHELIFSFQFFLSFPKIGLRRAKKHFWFPFPPDIKLTLWFIYFVPPFPL